MVSKSRQFVLSLAGAIACNMEGEKMQASVLMLRLFVEVEVAILLIELVLFGHLISPHVLDVMWLTICAMFSIVVMLACQSYQEALVTNKTCEGGAIDD